MEHKQATIEQILGNHIPCTFKKLFHYEPCKSCVGMCENYTPDKNYQIKRVEVKNWQGFINQIRRYNDGGVI